jgi:hypothetical protein
LGALLYLLCDIAALWLAVYALGYAVPAAPLVLAYLIGYLANTVPIPGGVGVLDGGLAGALLLYHVPSTAAVGGVLLYHAIALWIPALSGTAGFIGAQRQINAGKVRIALRQVTAHRHTRGTRGPASVCDERRGGGAACPHDARAAGTAAHPNCGATRTGSCA